MFNISLCKFKGGNNILFFELLFAFFCIKFLKNPEIPLFFLMVFGIFLSFSLEFISTSLNEFSYKLTILLFLELNSSFSYII